VDAPPTDAPLIAIPSERGFAPVDGTFSPPVSGTVEVPSQSHTRETVEGLEDKEHSSETPSGDNQTNGTHSEDQGQNETQTPLLELPDDYYEILQISRNADMETIHRVYRIMALRYHPDNEKTGNIERFLLLKRAYQILSDPIQRNVYNAAHQGMAARPLPQFEEKQFVYGIEGEVNRRLGVLSLLYNRRRMSDGSAGMSVLDMENRMSFPREYLSFTLWYLRSKNYVVLQDNSDYALTAEGVDYVEAHSSTNQVIRQLLTAGCGDGQTPADEPGGGSETAKSAAHDLM